MIFLLFLMPFVKVDLEYRKEAKMKSRIAAIILGIAFFPLIIQNIFGLYNTWFSPDLPNCCHTLANNRCLR